MKVGPIEKIPEAYTAIIDNRININGNEATVTSSDGTHDYHLKWNNSNMYFSNDNSTYWQCYPGYPVIAILLLQGKLTYDAKIAEYFKGINWHELNKKNSNDYCKSYLDSISKYDEDTKKKINNNINKVYEELKVLDIKITRRRNW